MTVRFAGLAEQSQLGSGDRRTRGGQ
jgi:hypothetical protein